ncbi:MAG: GNAT family N-acetyltransferase [Rubricella sp.]
MPEPKLERVEGYRAGVIAGMIRLHMRTYGPEWGFGAGFEALLAKEMGLFVDRYDARRDFFVTLWRDGDPCASLVIDGAKPMRAHLRWFVVDQALRGSGVGRALLEEALAFVDARGVPTTYLTTFKGLDAAAKLYTDTGFSVIRSEAEDRWKGGVSEQMWERPRPKRAQGL